MAGAAGVPVVQRTAMNNRFLRREDEDGATSNLSKAAREQLDEKKQRELERKLRQQQLDSFVTLKHSQLSEQWTSKAEPLPTGKEYLYIPPGSKVDVPVPPPGVALASSPGGTADASRARRASTSSLDFLGDVEDEAEKKKTLTAQKVKSAESVTALQKVRATNSRHNEILQEHNKSWEALRQKYAQGEGSDMGGIDISEAAADDAEIKAAEAQSNWPQIRKIVRSANSAPGTTQSDEDDGSSESDEGNDNSPEAIEKQIRKRKAKLAQQFSLGGNDRRGQMLQKQLDDAMKTIEQMREQYDRHMGELRLRLKLEMQAYEAAHGDKVAALQEDLLRSEEQLKALRTQHSTAVAEYERRLSDVVSKYELEQNRRESQEKRYEQQLADLDADLETSRSALRTLQKETKKEITELKDLLDYERREKATLAAKAEDLAQRLQQEIRERSAVESSLRESETKRETLGVEIKEVREQQVETVKTLTIARRESAVLLEGRANFEQAMIDRYQGQIDQLRASGQELQKNFDQLSSEKTYLAEQVESLTQQLREVDAQRRQMKSILAELQKTQKLLSSTTAENQGLKQRRVELICQNAILRATAIRLSRTTLLHKRILDLEEQNEWLVAKVTALSKRKIKDQPSSVGTGWWYQEADGTVDPMAQRIKALTQGTKDAENVVVVERDACTQVSSSEFDQRNEGCSAGGGGPPQRSLLWRTVEKAVQAPEEDLTAHDASAVAQLHRYMANSPSHDSLVAQLERKAELALRQRHDISLRSTVHPSHGRHDSSRGTASTSVEQPDAHREGVHAPDPASVASYIKLGHHHRPASATSDRSEGPDPLQPPSQVPLTKAKQRPTSAVSFRSEASTTANSMGSGPKAKTRPNSAVLHSSTSEGKTTSSQRGEEGTSGNLKIVKVTNPQPVPLPSLSLQGEKRRTVDLHQNPYNAFRQRNQRQREQEKQSMGSPDRGERHAPAVATASEPSVASPEAFHGFNSYNLHLDEEQRSTPSHSQPSSWVPPARGGTVIGASGTSSSAVAATAGPTPDPQSENFPSPSPSPGSEQHWLPTAYTIGAHKPLRSSSSGPSNSPSGNAPTMTSSAPTTTTTDPNVALAGPTNPFDGFKPSAGVPVGTWRPKSAKLR